MIFLPITSFPRASGRCEFRFLNSSDSISSLTVTAAFVLFGTSIPTTDFPGIGASILMSELARDSAKLSDRETILESLTPGDGSNS